MTFSLGPGDSIKNLNIVIEKEQNKKFFQPIWLVRYNKAFVGVTTTFILVGKQIVYKNPNYHWNVLWY